MQTAPSPTAPILCGTDFSANAAQAAEVAAALAARAQRPLVLLHALDEFNAHADAPEQLDRLCHRARAALDAEVERLAASGAKVTGEFRHGRLAERAIVERATEEPTGLIVVSAVSKSEFDRWTLGSVSEQVAESAPATTLVLRAHEPLQAWLRGERPLRVFVAADFSDCTEAALRWVAEWRALGPCEITVAHVDFPPEERRRLGIRGPETFNQNLPEVQYLLERELEEYAARILGPGAVKLSVGATWGRVDARIVELSREAHADLIVVGCHQRRGWQRLRHGSISRGILRHAVTNVAVVPATAAPAAAPQVRMCRRVVAAVDLSEHGSHAVPHAYGVVAEGGTVTLVHVIPRAAASESRQVAAQRVAQISAQVRALVPAEAVRRGTHSEVEVIEQDDLALGICQAAEAANADLLCLGAHARPGLVARAMGSVAARVLQQCRRPVLIVWPPEA